MTDRSTPDKARDAHARTAETYRGYAQSGHAERWRDEDPGNILMLDERDRWLVGAVGTVAGRTVVDVGCGDGNVARTLERHGARPARFVGVDLLPSRIQAARTQTSWAGFAVASAELLPLAGDSVDVVVASTLFSSLLESWQRLAAAREMRRVIRGGGRVVVYDLRYPNPGNGAVRRVTTRELRALFPGWTLGSSTLTLLPPLARSGVGRGRLRYRLLTSLPLLRSHIGVVLVRPETAT
jgi:SAM-dependent methyltransferase